MNMQEKPSKIEGITRVMQATFARAGYRGTSVSDLANALSINKSSIYHYFSSKEQIAIAVVESLTR